MSYESKLSVSLITVVIPQTFNPLAELAVPIGMLTNEAKIEIEMHPVIIETK